MIGYPDVPLRRRLLHLLPCLLATAGLLTSSARGEEKKGAWEAGFLFGNNFFTNEQRIANADEYGIRIGWYWKPSYEWEFQYRTTSDAKVQESSSTLIKSDVVFFANPDRTFSTDSYAFRFLINPRNERRRLKPYAVFGYSLLRYAPSPTLQHSEEGQIRGRPVILGGGIRMRLMPHMAFRGEYTTEYEPTHIYHNEHLDLGLTWVWGGGGGAGGSADSDGDGVLDLNDRCPETPKGARVNQQGCPRASDGDGIPDGIDKCPDTPKGAIVDPMDSPTAGCPHDTDNDGVFDGVDTCPLTPAGAIVDEKGCPHDSDGDRVLDGLDQCPDTPKGQKIDKEGCPRVRLDKPEPQILPNVKFVQGIELWPGTDAWLQLLVDALTYWSDVNVEIGVYTDSKGSAAANRQIAQRRAEVIREWLVQHGIDKSRISIKGYGAVNFVADNDTEEGREKNRRVEVKRTSGDLRKHPKPVPEEAAPPAAPEPAQPSPEPAPEQPAPAPPATTPPAAAPPAPEATPAPAPPGPEPTPTPAPEPTPSPAPTPAPPVPAPSPTPGP